MCPYQQSSSRDLPPGELVRYCDMGPSGKIVVLASIPAPRTASRASRIASAKVSAAVSAMAWVRGRRSP